MVEQLPRRYLQLRSGPFAIIENVTRRHIEGPLPPLLEDARSNYLIEVLGDRIDVYLKPVAGPYTGEHGTHLLVVPDAKDRSNLPAINDLTSEDLARVLRFVESVAYATLNQEGISEVDFGWHHSRGEFTAIPKQRAATFPKNLHIHITGYSREDMKILSSDEVLTNPDLRGKTADSLHFLSEELFLHEIIPYLRENFSFDEIFEQMMDQRGRIRFRMRGGREGFRNPKLAEILQAIDSSAKDLYDEIARCFFKYDEGKEKFVEKGDEYRRLLLLPVEERRARIRNYIKDRPWLSKGAKKVLQVLADEAKDEKEVLDRELGKASPIDASTTDFRSDDILKQAANRFWAYKGLVYTMVWSAKKGENGGIEWIFGFDPMVFTVEGIPQSSSFTDKIILKRQGEHYTPEQLAKITTREERIVDAVLGENPKYQRGKVPSEV